MATPQRPNLWAPLRVGHVPERIAERILGHITAEQLRPGERLPPERELAQLLGVSRPSLREALKSLQARGHVDVRHGAGVYVAEPPSTRALQAALSEADMSVAELFAMREVLEGPAAEWAAERQDGHRLLQVQEVYDELLAASLEPDIEWRRLQSLDAAFHLRIVDAAGNRFLRQTAGVLHEMLLRGMETTLAIPGRLEQSRRDHEQILRALLDADGSGARQAACAHIRGARDAALARLEANHANEG
jgi:GntR family transcriptional regulator, transcriptional repressor for pyruvate dehydrogenase complex